MGHTITPTGGMVLAWLPSVATRTSRWLQREGWFNCSHARVGCNADLRVSDVLELSSRSVIDATRQWGKHVRCDLFHIPEVRHQSMVPPLATAIVVCGNNRNHRCTLRTALAFHVVANSQSTRSTMLHFTDGFLCAIATHHLNDLQLCSRRNFLRSVISPKPWRLLPVKL